MTRPSWDEHFMDFARLAATRSKDTTQVGCVAIGEAKQVLTTGYNGLPRGVIEYEPRSDRPAKYLWTAHAEENAVAHAARTGTSLLGARVYVTHAPCARCARLLIQAGVSSVLCCNGTTSMPEEEFTVARAMFREAGVVFEQLINHHLENTHAGPLRN
jgi:dCMP deaminase